MREYKQVSGRLKAFISFIRNKAEGKKKKKLNDFFFLSFLTCYIISLSLICIIFKLFQCKNGLISTLKL
jgi:hypothetical protein